MCASGEDWNRSQSHQGVTVTSECSIEGLQGGPAPAKAMVSPSGLAGLAAARSPHP